MRAVLALLAALALCGPAWAQRIVLSAAQPRPILSLDFRRMATLDPRVSFTRSTSLQDWNCASPPVLTTFGVNTASLGVCDPLTGTALGMGVWGQSTIANRWSNDLTQSVWTRSASMTVALDQTGPDGTANSASSLTAGAADQTVIYNAPPGAHQYVLSATVKCLTCTGEIDMTLDGGQVWQNVTSLLSDGWRRIPSYGIYETTPAQPGFRIRTAGDSIAVAYVNAETDTNSLAVAPTPPVLTTSTNNTVRGAGFPSIDMRTIPGWNPDAWIAVMGAYIPTLPANGDSSADHGLFQADDCASGCTPANVIYVRQQTDPSSNIFCVPATNPGVTPFCADVNVSSVVAGATPPSGGKTRCSYNGNQFQGLVNPIARAFMTVIVAYIRTGTNNLQIFCNTGAGSGNAQLTPWATAVSSWPSGTFNRFVLGVMPSSIGTLTGPLNGYIPYFNVYSGSPAQMQAILARMAPTVPQRPPTHPLLQGGGYVLYETGSAMLCNGC